MPVLEGGGKAEKLIYDMNSIHNEISRKEWEFAKRLQTLYNLLRIEQASPFLCKNRSCPIPKIMDGVSELLDCYDEVLEERNTLIKAKKEFQDLIIASDDENDKEEGNSLASDKQQNNAKEGKKRILIVASQVPKNQE